MSVEFVPGQRNYKVGRCEANRELVLQMVKDGHYLAEIGRRIGTKGTKVAYWLRRNGVTQDFPVNRGGDQCTTWKGGSTITKDGYREIHCPGHPAAKKHTPYILEHRLVMEKMIGRFLESNEVVHHKDGNRLNNSPENLHLFSENRHHLAHELAGRCPKWSAAGLDRMKERRLLRKSRAALGIPWNLTGDVELCSEIETRLKASPHKVVPPLLRKALLLCAARRGSSPEANRRARESLRLSEFFE